MEWRQEQAEEDREWRKHCERLERAFLRMEQEAAQLHKIRKSDCEREKH